MDNIDWNGSEVPEDATHVRVAGDKLCYYKGITESGSYFYMNPFQDKWEQGIDFPIGWFEGELIKRPDTPKLASLLNTKIDLRKEDGTIDIELSKAFQEAVTGGDKFKYSGYVAYSDIKDYYTQNAHFIFVDEKGMLSLMEEGSAEYFSKHPSKQINFKYTRKLEWEATEVDVTPEVELVDGRAYMFDFNKTKDIVGILHSDVQYGSLHRMFCTGNGTKYNSDYATNIKRLVPESVE